MIPVSFAESNVALSKPPGMTHEECEPLCVWQGCLANGHPVTVSCWKLTKEDLEQITKTGRVWLWVYGPGMPPVALETKNPFE